MNKLYKILFIIGFVFTILFSYFIIANSQYFTSYFIYFLLFLIFLLLIIFYVYNLILIFKNRVKKLEKEDLYVPIIFVLFQVLIIISFLILNYRFDSLFDSFFSVYYVPFIFIPCIINLIWTYLIFRNKKEESEDKNVESI